MVNQITKDGNFIKSLDTQYLGEINALGHNSIVINLNSFQNVTSSPTPKFKLNVYKSNIPYLGLNYASSNIEQLEYCKCYNIDCSVSSENGGSVNKNNDVSVILGIDAQYYNFTISTPSVNDLYYEFSANVQKNPVDRYKGRDDIIELNEITLLTKPITNFKIDSQAGSLKGLSTWSMSCKGDLTNTEFCLYEDAINTKGYFDLSGEVHKANQIIISSTSSNDTNSSGIGAHSVEITGLNSNFQEVKEQVFLGGTTEVYLSTQMTDVNSAQVLISGGLYCNAGTIKIFNSDVNGGTSSNPMCTIPMNYGKDQNSQYTVPIGYTLIIQKVMISSHCEDAAEILFNKYMWLNGDTNINKHRIKTYHLHSSTTVNENISLTIDEKERFTITAQTSIAPTGINRVSCEVFGYLKLKQFSKSTNTSYNTKKYIEGLDTLPLALP